MKEVLLVNDTRLVGHHGSNSVVDVIFHEFARRDVAVRSQLQLGLGPDKLDANRFRAVVINGEGAMHHGQKNSREFARLGEEIAGRGVPIFLINTLYDEDLPYVVERMQHFTAIYCRETPSAQRLRAQGIAAELCPDLTFALQVPEGLHWRPGDRIVVLDTTVARKNRILHRFSIDNGFDFRPIRHAPPLLRATSWRNHSRIARFNATKAVGKLLRRSYRFNRYANAVTDRGEYLRQISDGVRVVVAARFHGVCLCLKLGVPFLAIASNTPKIEGMLADAGLGDRMIDIADLSADAVRAWPPWTSTHAERAARYVASAQAQIEQMFDAIVRRIN